MYEDFYHLSAKPFRLSPDPGFFFPSRGHKRALAYLRYGLSQDEGFVVITGAPGTGKTTLAQILLREMDQSDLIVAHLTTTQLEADEMLRMVAASFGLRHDGVNKAGLLKTLEAFLLARSRERKRVLLVIDEAQNLPSSSLEELRMLSNLQVGEKALVQTFLLGQAQFRHKLDHPDLEQLRQRVIANYHLSELAEDECQSYIETRLQHVGWVDDPMFSSDAYRGIYEYTQGIPRRINMLCDRLMLFSCLEERHVIDKDVLREVTEELQQEISGVPIKLDDLTDDPDGADYQDESPEISAEPDIEEHETQGKQVADSQGQNISEENVAESILEDNSMDKAVPDDGYENLDVQAQTGEAAKSNEDSDSKNHGVVHHNKERFQVISGGRTDSHSSPSLISDETLRPANNPPTDIRAPLPDAPGDSEEVVLRKILRLVLAYHRSPRSFPGLDDPSQPLPKGLTQILTLAISDDEALKNLRQIAVMGISPAMLRAAVRFFVRRVLFVPGGDDYRVLGLTADAPQGLVEEHYGLLMRLMRQEKKSSEESGVHRIGEAYERLFRGEITHIPDETPLEESNSDFEDLEELDLDLAPDLGEPLADSSVSGSVAGDSPDIITSEERTGHAGRNILLIVGAVVVMFVLYLTQISTTTIDMEPVAETDMATMVEPPVDESSAVPQAETPTISNELQESRLVTQEAVENAIPTEDFEENSSVEQVQANEQDAEERRQRILAELREKSRQEEIERARQAAIEQERARLEAELRKANQAQAEAEARAQREAQARARAEAEARAAAEKAAAEARAAANLKAKQQAAITEAQQTAAQDLASVPVSSREDDTPSILTGSGDIRISALDSHINQYEDAYANGSINKLRTLFSETARTNNHTDIEGLVDNYQTEFNNTSARNIRFTNVDWKVDNTYARGNGNFEKTVTTNGTTENTVTTGNATLQLEVKSGQLKITRMYFSDEVTKTQSVVDSSLKATNEELNELLARFVQAYGEGEIESFIALFSPDAKTNDRDSVEGIREDYIGLFNTTESRNMELADMEWLWDDGVAKSTGRFMVEVQPGGQSSINVYRGKLWFHVIKAGDELKISYFAFTPE